MDDVNGWFNGQVFDGNPELVLHDCKLFAYFLHELSYSGEERITDCDEKGDAYYPYIPSRRFIFRGCQVLQFGLVLPSQRYNLCNHHEKAGAIGRCPWGELVLF
jgi:hypothetical protein